MSRATAATTSSDRRRLVLLSSLMLFVELALIRWAGANVVYLAYFTNFVLLASFLGIGIGFLRARAERDLFGLAPVTLAGFVAFVSLFPVQVTRAGGWRTFVGILDLPALPPFVELPLIFVGAVAVMATIAQGVARTFARFEPLEAYRLDIAGSILGIVAFSVLAFLTAPPVAWGAIAAGALAFLLWRRAGLAQWLGIGAIVLLLGLGSISPLDRWSPYYRVTVLPPTEDGRIDIRVNSIPHQSIVPAAELRIAEHIYQMPYRRTPGNPREDVLIVGAGNGNDVAVALDRGAGHVDAVEIDPVLQAIGRDRHPARPYQDPRVEAHIDDGRAFLERTGLRYDLILFALPDSLTLVSGQSSLRLESYLFTEEAMRDAREHLRPGGAFAMYNYYRPKLLERFAGTLERVYGRPPCVDLGARRGLRTQAVLTVGRDQGAVRCDGTWRAKGAVPPPATDDHPFPYLYGRAIPGFYLGTLTLIVAGSAVLVRAAAGPLVRMRGYLDLFFMGAAFLLLETKSVVQFALWFGTTWFVNALVFAGILLSVLAAIEVARRVTFRRHTLLYAWLLVTLAVAWAVPPSFLLSVSFWPRFAIAIAIAFAPIFLANLVFAQRFRDVGSSTVAFGANLLGAMAGGVLEYAALITGYRALLVLVAALYGLAFLFGRAHLASGPPSLSRSPC